MGLPADRRQPVWSGPLTTPLAARIPVRHRPAALAIIKAIHTAVFFSVAALIALFAWDGIRQRPRRRTAVAAVIALIEAAVYGSNNQVCPLTPLAEDLGAASGSVTDIYLPGWLSRRIPLISSAALILGLILNLRARRTAVRTDGPAMRPAAGPMPSPVRARPVRAAPSRAGASRHRAVCHAR
jgi:hypothetical protein